MKPLIISEAIEIIEKNTDSTRDEICNVKLRKTIPHRQILCHALRYYGVAYRDIAELFDGQKYGHDASRLTILNYATATLTEAQDRILGLIKESFGVPESKRQEKALPDMDEQKTLLEDAIKVVGLPLEGFCKFICYPTGTVLLYLSGLRVFPRRLLMILSWIVKYGIRP